MEDAFCQPNYQDQRKICACLPNSFSINLIAQWIEYHRALMKVFYTGQPNGKAPLISWMSKNVLPLTNGIAGIILTIILVSNNSF